MASQFVGLYFRKLNTIMIMKRRNNLMSLSFLFNIALNIIPSGVVTIVTNK